MLFIGNDKNEISCMEKIRAHKIQDRSANDQHRRTGAGYGVKVEAIRSPVVRKLLPGYSLWKEKDQESE
jgi:hypothetical protein